MRLWADVKTSGKQADYRGDILEPRCRRQTYGSSTVSLRQLLFSRTQSAPFGQVCGLFDTQ